MTKLLIKKLLSPKSQNIKNVYGPVFQVITGAVSLFFLFRYINIELGIGEIGILSLVTSITSISRFGDLGLSVSVIRFVAQAVGERDKVKAADIIQTATILLGVFMAIVLVIIYPIFNYILELFLYGNELIIARGILPFVMVFIWFSIIVNIFSGGLDGCLRLDLRGLLLGTSSFVYLGFVYILTPLFGLRGVIIAHILQYILLMLSMWVILRRQIDDLPIIPIKIKTYVIKDMISYGMTFQADLIINRLFDPLIKFLLTSYGGIVSVGFYEIANRLVHQLRAIMVEAIRLIIPNVAALSEKDHEKRNELYFYSTRFVFFTSLLLFGILGIFIKPISLLWLGEIQTKFINFSLILILGWFINLLSVTAFFINIGTGNLKFNVISNTLINLTILLFGIILGKRMGDYGVVISIVIGLLVGSGFLISTHKKGEGKKNKSLLLDKKHITMIFAVSILILFSNFISSQISSIPVIVLVYGISAVALIITGWINPLRTEIVNTINKEI